ncbi:hypothetical protein Goshw_015193 [Gossypium schwendimanii]|uniref:Uncharacterized protein n=1 Tax=Gossypium schwendimanii TaxID=34291 RepID=A0A7J9MNH3_GOSSC|nr:hypothetical protein [Gossypium schwendimanii]
MEKGFLDKVEDNAAVQACVTQNSLQELKKIWNQWNEENPAYSCFMFVKVDLVPTVEEYMALLRCSKIQVDRVYSRVVNVLTFLKKS